MMEVMECTMPNLLLMFLQNQLLLLAVLFLSNYFHSACAVAEVLRTMSKEQIKMKYQKHQIHFSLEQILSDMFYDAETKAFHTCNRVLGNGLHISIYIDSKGL